MTRSLRVLIENIRAVRVEGMTMRALKQTERTAEPTKTKRKASKMQSVVTLRSSEKPGPVKSSPITFGSVTIDVVRATGAERERNIAEGVAALRRGAKALITPGVVLDLPPSAPRYHSDPEVAGRLVRVMNGKETVGTFVNGKFKPAK